MIEKRFGHLEAVTFDFQGTLMLGDIMPRLGLVEAVRTLGAAGINWGIVSTGPQRKIRDVLVKQAITDDLLPAENIVGSDTKYDLSAKSGYIPTKPSPAGIRHLLEIWKVEPSAAVHIGDEADDQLAAERAGVTFVHANELEILDESVLDLVNQAVNQLNQSSHSL